MINISKTLLFICLIILVGCGGGSDNTPEPPPSPPPVTDTQPPVITITGENPAFIGYNKEYIDAGASASDNVDSNVTVTVSSDVDTSTIGTYSVTYTATDSAGNTASAMRVVNVIDDVAPIITVSSELNLTLEQDSIFITPSATANDEIDGAVTVSVEGNVNTQVLGNYQIIYSASDSSGNYAQVILNVTVHGALTKVEITYFGDGEITANKSLSCNDFKLCQVELNVGDELLVTATASSGHVLASWEGCDEVNDNVCRLQVKQETLLDATFKSEQPLQINNNVIQLSEMQIRAITDYTNNGVITFDSTTDISGFEIGKVLVSTGIYIAANDPDNVEIYFARRISKIVSLPGSSILIETSEASLADIINEGTLSFDVALGVEDVDVRSLTGGISLDLNRLQTINSELRTSGQMIPFQIDVKIGQVTVKGSVDVSIDPDLDIDFSLANIIDEFKFQTRVNATSNISILVGASGEKLFEDEVPIGGPILFAPITIGPVIFIPKIQFFLQSSVDVDFGWEPKVTIGARMVGGVHYIHGKGWHNYRQHSGSISASVLTPENITAKISASAGPGADLGLLLYGLVGPKVSAVGSGGVEAFYVSNSSACKVDFNVIYKAMGKFAGEFSLLSKQLKYEAKLFEVQKIIEKFSRDCPADKPNKPLITEISDISGTSVKVNWLVESDDASIIFRVLRNYKDLGIETSEKSFIDSGLEQDTTYCYSIVAVNNSPEPSDPSDEVCIKTEEEDNTAPDTPSMLTATTLSSRSISLSWVVNDDADAFVVYEINQAGGYIAREQVSKTDTIVTGLLADTEYCFAVTAIDDNGNESEYTLPACATTKTVEQAAWDIFIACEGSDYQVTAKLDLDEEYTSSVSVVGTGNDYDGTALAFNLFGTYSSDNGILNADINWSFEGSSEVRKDRFSADLSTGDSGDVPMTLVEDNGGCDAVIRFIKEQSLHYKSLSQPIEVKDKVQLTFSGN